MAGESITKGQSDSYDTAGANTVSKDIVHESKNKKAREHVVVRNQSVYPFVHIQTPQIRSVHYPYHLDLDLDFLHPSPLKPRPPPQHLRGHRRRSLARSSSTGRPRHPRHIRIVNHIPLRPHQARHLRPMALPRQNPLPRPRDMRRLPRPHPRRARRLLRRRRRRRRRT